MPELILTVLGLVFGGAIVFFALRFFGKRAPETITTAAVAERARAVGRLVALEVSAKEIATSVKGWSWMPPLLLSQARLAMIFHFEKQYSVDLARLRERDVELVAESPRPRFRITLPPIEGALRLTDVEPYDIQAGRVLGLLDVIQVNAPTQKDLMRRAQDQAASLFTHSDEKYTIEARSSAERHLRSLLQLFRVDVDIAWSDAPSGPAAAPSNAPSRLPGVPAAPRA